MDPEDIRQELIHIKSLNIDGVVVDCWWGIVEGWSPQKYVWSGYRELFNIIREFKLNLQVYILIAHIISCYTCIHVLQNGKFM
jgi:beta-amylase